MPESRAPICNQILAEDYMADLDGFENKLHCETLGHQILVVVGMSGNKVRL